MGAILAATLVLLMSDPASAQSIIDRCSLDRDDTRDSIRAKLARERLRAEEVDDGFIVSGKFAFGGVTFPRADVSLSFDYGDGRFLSSVVYARKRGTIVQDIRDMDAICQDLAQRGYTFNADALTSETFPCSYTRKFNDGCEIMYSVILNKQQKQLKLLESLFGPNVDESSE